MTLRHCTRCQNAKPADAFSADPRGGGGLSSRCKACKAEIARERRATAKRGAAPVVELRPGLRLVESAPDPEGHEATPVPDVNRAPGGGGRHRDALEQAVAAATWLTPVHAAAVAYARSLADLLDAATLEGLLPGRAEPQYLLALKALGLASASEPVESDKPVMRPAAANY